MKIFPSLLPSSPLAGEESKGEGVLAIRFIFGVRIRHKREVIG
jgi:hypothetical protein